MKTTITIPTRPTNTPRSRPAADPWNNCAVTLALCAVEPPVAKPLPVVVSVAETRDDVCGDGNEVQPQGTTILVVHRLVYVTVDVKMTEAGLMQLHVLS